MSRKQQQGQKTEPDDEEMFVCFCFVIEVVID